MSGEHDELLKFIETAAERHQASGTITESTELIESQILDSVNLVRLILFIQQKWGVEIDFNDLGKENFRDLKTIRDTIERIKTRS